ncbi:MAG: hypothetical protein CMO12_04250 [Thaumarchaeota archaeon]|nr:hypothetical protein [Nitrososphaerota archaeon]
MANKLHEQDRSIRAVLSEHESYPLFGYICEEAQTPLEILQKLKMLKRPESIHHVGRILGILEDGGIVSYRNGKWRSTPHALKILQKYWGVKQIK